MNQAKSIDIITNSPPGTFEKYLEMDKIIARAGELWRKINIYSTRNLIKENDFRFKCPKCNDGLLNINWNKKGMSYSCLDKNCKFEYPN